MAPQEEQVDSTVSKESQSEHRASAKALSFISAREPLESNQEICSRVLKARQNSCPTDPSRNAHHRKSKANHGKYLGAETICGMRVGIKSRDSSSGNRILNSY
jgi:hypothetical protein